MDKITKANYKAPLYPIGDKFTTTPARVGHLNQVIDGLNELITTSSVIQAGSNTSAVTINARAGVITMQGPLSPGAPTTYTFTVNNSFVTTNSVILLTVDYSSSADAADNIVCGMDSLISGSFDIVIRAITSTSGTPIKINFLVIG
jgi:hypothetical protein